MAKTASKHLYNRFAEIGRVVLVQVGPDAGKLATIIDIVDQNRALVDGPVNVTGVKRQMLSFKNMALTDLKLDGYVEVDGKRTRVSAGLNARQKTLTAVWKALNIKAKWDASSWGKRVAAKAADAKLTDLGRFKAKVSHQKTARAIRAKLSA